MTLTERLDSSTMPENTKQYLLGLAQGSVECFHKGDIEGMMYTIRLYRLIEGFYIR